MVVRTCEVYIRETLKDDVVSVSVCQGISPTPMGILEENNSNEGEVVAQLDLTPARV